MVAHHLTHNKSEYQAVHRIRGTTAHRRTSNFGLLENIAETMAGVLRSPPQAGQNVTEWAKQQACRKRALETHVEEISGFRERLMGAEDHQIARKTAREDGRVDRAVEAITEVMQKDAQFWQGLRSYARQRKLLFPDDERALVPAVNLPKMVPTDKQAERLIKLLARCEELGFEA